jgi:hypothetical protein
MEWLCIYVTMIKNLPDRAPSAVYQPPGLGLALGSHQGVTGESMTTRGRRFPPIRRFGCYAEFASSRE